MHKCGYFIKISKKKYANFSKNPIYVQRKYANTHDILGYKITLQPVIRGWRAISTNLDYILLFYEKSAIPYNFLQGKFHRKSRTILIFLYCRQNSCTLLHRYKVKIICNILHIYNFFHSLHFKLII